MSSAFMMDKSLDNLICALCGDFDRRRRAIEEKKLPMRVLLEYKFLNYKILEATIEIVGAANALTFIEDIGAHRGYAKSMIEFYSEGAYKKAKALVKQSIALRLALGK